VSDPAPAAAPKPKLGDRLKAMLAEYGPIALGTYLAIFALVLAGSFFAIRFGFATGESAAGTAGTLGAAYALTKLSQPIRILVSLALTPLVARVLRYRRS
jgi:hypothetical protein